MERKIKKIFFEAIFNSKIFNIIFFNKIVNDQDFPKLTGGLDKGGTEKRRIRYYGAFFSWMFVGYVISSFLVSISLKQYTSRTIIIVGGFLLGLSHILAGPSILLPNDVKLMFIGRTLIGLFLASLIIAPLIEITDISIPKYPDHKIKVTDMWAGFFNSALCFGQTIQLSA